VRSSKASRPAPAGPPTAHAASCGQRYSMHFAGASQTLDRDVRDESSGPRVARASLGAAEAQSATMHRSTHPTESEMSLVAYMMYDSVCRY